MAETKLKVEGMHCKSCGILLTDVISEISGVENVSVDFKAGLVSVSCRDGAVLGQVKDAITKEGYKVV